MNRFNNIDYIETHIAPPLSAAQRLQEYGVEIFNAVSTKSALKKALKKEYITVNGFIACTATFIKGGEVIKLTIPEKVSPKRTFIFPLKVLFEDEHLAVIHKPAGILVSGNHFKTITNALSQNIIYSSLVDATIPQPVHRLDYATTGILLVGKTNSSIRAMNKFFEDKAIIKTYHAITIGKMNPEGKIDVKINGKRADSDYKLLKSVPSERFGKLNLVQLHPRTGRRHQLRIHLSSIGNPILGDKIYGIESLILDGKGLYLHARSLEFKHPFTKEKMLFIDEPPPRFKKIFPESFFD